MKAATIYFRLFIVLVVTLGIFPTISTGQQEDRTESPYFFVQSDNPEVDQLPLESTSAQVNIAGIIADVTVTQVYKNEGENPLEAIYVFPASTRAAVYAMEMKIGNRTITADIKEKGQARREYEAAKASGKRTSLLEQHRPNVFQMNVANILPGDQIIVELKYTELLVPTDKVYEFVYPTVVGPRYNDPATASSNNQFVAQPYTKEKEPPTYDFDIEVYLSAGLPIQDITCTSHQVNVNFEKTALANIQLDSSETKGGNRDFILNYQLAGGKIESGLLLYEHEDEHFFLTMVQPPKRITPDQIPPREYVFIVDVSGSMRGFPLNISKKLLRDLIVNLRPTDKFNVMLFASTSVTMAEESVYATPENIDRAINVIDNQRGGGGTRLLPALKKALALPRCEASVSRSMVVVTDGYVSVEKEAFDLIRNNLDQSNLFTFGIGKSINRHLIEGMAHVGAGEPLIITSPDNSNAQAEKFRKYISSPVLTQVKATYPGFEVYDVQPSSIPDVLSDRPVLLFGKYKGKPNGKITLQGYSGNQLFHKTFDVSATAPSKRNSALRYLWAREKIKLENDYMTVNKNQKRIQEITQLGLKYNLLTPYTSFIAVDNEVAVDYKKPAPKNTPTAQNKKKPSTPQNNRSTNPVTAPVTVQQPLPMPAGVSNSAVGFDAAIEGVVRRNKVKSYSTAMVSGCPSESLRRLLEKAINIYLKTIDPCNHNNHKGALLFEITIDQHGKVLSAIPATTNHPKDDSDCLIQAMKKWHFKNLNITESISLKVSIQ